MKFNPRDLQPQLETILKLAVRYDVRFYTLDSRGLYGAAEVPGSGESASSAGGNPDAAMTVAWQNGDAMAQLARQTGGQFFENTNDLLKGIRRSFGDGRQEYTLVYAADNTELDGKFRRITVKVKDQKLTGRGESRLLDGSVGGNATTGPACRSPGARLRCRTRPGVVRGPGAFPSAAEKSRNAWGSLFWHAAGGMPWLPHRGPW